ncbi:hypothetical protein Ancab_002258 [Ancistrocladus abbreviatus]
MKAVLRLSSKLEATRGIIAKPNDELSGAEFGRNGSNSTEHSQMALLSSVGLDVEQQVSTACSSSVVEVDYGDLGTPNDDKETQQLGYFWARNCEYVHVTFHVNALSFAALVRCEASGGRDNLGRAASVARSCTQQSEILATTLPLQQFVNCWLQGTPGRRSTAVGFLLAAVRNIAFELGAVSLLGGLSSYHWPYDFNDHQGSLCAGVGATAGDDLSKQRQPPSGRSAKSGSLKSPTHRATAKQKVYGALTAILAANGRSAAFPVLAVAGLSGDRRGQHKPSVVLSLCYAGHENFGCQI